MLKIEKLDQRFPGLANQVRQWFNEGVTVRKVEELLALRYNVRVPRPTIGRFRARRWVPERELSREKRITAAAIGELLRELQLKDSPAASTAEDQAKLTAFLLADNNRSLQPVGPSLIELSRCLVKKRNAPSIEVHRRCMPCQKF